MDTTLLGWPFRAAISCPMTKFHILQLWPLDTVKSNSSVASKQTMGLVWPLAMEMHYSGAV